MIDDIDREILDILQRNARTSNAEIARRVGMAPSATLERVRKLEERGVIEGYGARLNARVLGFGLSAYVFVGAEERLGAAETSELLSRLPECQEVHRVAGDDGFLVKVRVADTEALGRLLREKIGAIPTVRSTRTTIVLDTIKETDTLPVDGVAAAMGEGGAEG